MKIAVEGCAHGELDNIYDTIQHLEKKQGFKVDLLICCGDFQASRNEEDLRCMAVPPKYYRMCSFYKYYTGEKVAPVLTLFIGGNHEASNYLQELPYGGWVAPKIYYLGYAGVVNIAGIRIGGISGIYKGRDYMKGHFEYTPYNDYTKRSVYHIRNLEIFRLKQISEPLNIFLSHDWPSGVWEYGNTNNLLRIKPFFEDDIRSGELGSKPSEELLKTLKPEYWFAAHLHCKFAALIPHSCGKTTKFLSLDKCLPRRRFLQIVDIPHDSNLKIEISYDLEWLTILRLTNHLLSIRNLVTYMPGPGGNEKWCFSPTDEEKTSTSEKFGDSVLVPDNFVKTAVGYSGQDKSEYVQQPNAVSNPQTVLLCEKLSIDDPLSFLLNLEQSASTTFEDAAEDVIDKETFVDSELSLASPKKVVLILPKPVHDNEEEGNEDNKEEHKIDKDKDDAGGIVTSANATEIQADAEANTSKTFKRRNASIYQDEGGE